MIPHELNDIYNIASVYCIKGVVGAQSVYDLLLIDEAIQSEKPCIVFKNRIIYLEYPDYMKMAISDMKENYMIHLPIKLSLYENIDTFKEELIILLDYIYKKGLEISMQYTGTNFMDMRNGNNRYFSPNGYVKKDVWHSMIRKYLMELHTIYGRIKDDEIDKFIVRSIINDQKQQEEKQQQDARRDFILSSGTISLK